MIKFIKHNSLEKFPLEDESIQTCVTSPPYWSLRQYTSDPNEIGNEPTVAEYIQNLCRVFDEVWRVLKPTGSLLVNLGDKFLDKELQLIPYRLAFALMDRGWVLRNDIKWIKTNAMPCPVKDRLRSSHEPMFWFVKDKSKYYSDINSVRMPHLSLDVEKYASNKNLAKKLNGKVEVYQPVGLLGEVEEVNTAGYVKSKLDGENQKNVGARGGFAKNGENLNNRYADGGRNPGDVFLDDSESNNKLDYTCERCDHEQRVELPLDGDSPDIWIINSDSFSGKHTAVFPKRLVENCIRITSRVGDTVLDPFAGSGTTSAVAESLGRNSVGFDLGYEDVREDRLKEGIVTGLFV